MSGSFTHQAEIKGLFHGEPNMLRPSSRSTAVDTYLKHLGPAGLPAPQYVPADKTPAGPFVQFPEPPNK